MKQQYDSYKPSGIDWIGDIPSHWDIAPLKRNLRMPLKYGANEPAESDDKNYPRYIRITDIDSNGNLKDETFKSLDPSKATEYLLEKGDVLFARSGATVGKTYIFNEPYKACFAGYLIKASCSSRLSPQFLFYYTNSGMYNNWKNSIFIQSTIQNIGADKYSILPLPIPPLAEQEAIAAWLDKKCEEIDAAIAKVDREIELIDELKQSEISHVVTRGLNPDAPLRPSGIDWIGDIPEHWELKPLKYNTDIIMGQSPSGNDIKDNGVVLFMQGNGEFGDIYPNPSTYCDVCVKHSRMGDILMSVRAPVGELNISDKIYGIGRGLCSIQTYNLSRQFLWHYLLKSKIDFDYFSNGSTFSAITIQTLREFPITNPPLSEQQEIADYLDKKCAEIDGLKAKLTKKRETLKELRQSVISEVVTGKRKVI